MFAKPRSRYGNSTGLLQRLPYVLRPRAVLEYIKRRVRYRPTGRNKINTQILCIAGGAICCPNWVRELQQRGYAVVYAANQREAATLLKIFAVDVICIDSQIVAQSSGLEIVADLKYASQGVPVVVVRTGNHEVTEHFRERNDVAVDGSTFSRVGSRLIEDSGEVQFPMFVEWFEAWEKRTAGKSRDVSNIY